MNVFPKVDVNPIPPVAEGCSGDILQREGVAVDLEIGQAVIWNDVKYGLAGYSEMQNGVDPVFGRLRPGPVAKGRLNGELIAVRRLDNRLLQPRTGPRLNDLEANDGR